MSSLTQRSKVESATVVGIVAAVAICMGLLVWFLARSAAHDGDKARPMHSVDLVSHFTETPTTTNDFARGWVRGPQDLVCILAQLQTFGEVRFSVKGIILLMNREDTGSRYPERVDGIPIQRVARLLHLLHGSTGWSSDGVPIAKIVFHYSDGADRERFLLYGNNMRDWFQSKEDLPPEPGSAIAWTMHNPLSKNESAKLRVYRTSLENPRPGLAVVSVDYVSMLTGCTPFLLAMTVEE